MDTKTLVKIYSKKDAKTIFKVVSGIGRPRSIVTEISDRIHHKVDFAKPLCIHSVY